MKDYSTGQVAKICKVCPRTVAKWFDSGGLQGYRIANSRVRRITRNGLINFLNKYDLTLEDLKEGYGIYEAATISKVSAGTLINWVDSGKLKGYLIPLSKHRRIPKDSLIEFLKENNMPLGDLEDEDLVKVIFISSNELRISTMKASLSRERGFKLAVAANGFEAAIQIQAFNPKILIVDFSIGKIEANLLCQNLRKNSDYKNLVVLAIIQESEMLGLDRSSINEIFKSPLDLDFLTYRLEKLTGKIKNPE